MADPKAFSVRIVSIDYYMTPPIPDIDICYSSFQGGKVNEVPVIRIYGSTPAGQKTCLHIHRALPYLYVPCMDITVQPQGEDVTYPHIICLAIEKALKLRSSAGSKQQHVHGCSLVRARKLYGYHSSEELFVKIYLYYPHDVSRAASLLLGGAVLNKCLQPHESHIPFLLQFMADSSGDVCLSSSVWISSTIPGDWLWKSSRELGASDQVILLVKRQSACELEVDSAVDEILNQQFKMYSSFSQSHTDVKMVQSLIPIWEEEYERTGIHEAAIAPDPGKPSVKDVLKILSHGLGFEDKLLELGREAETSSTPFQKDRKFVQSIGTSTCGGTLVEHGGVKSCNNDRDPSESSSAKNILDSLLSQGTLFEEKYGAVHCEREDVYSKLFEGLPFDLLGTLAPKGTDKEALGLLKWLASSQAVEDINSDDELVCETILSPLLPATTINKVLEKANKDFESESQQECQDILDSIDLVDFERLKEQSSPVNRSISPDETIPQLDGSGDDQYRNASSDLFEIEIHSESEITCQHQLQQDAARSFCSKHKRKKPLWGSLPLSMSLKVDDVVQPVKFNMSGGSGTKAAASAEKVAGKCSDSSLNNIETDFCDLKEANSLVGCSVRQLMRKRRFQRLDPPECKTHKVKKILLEEDRKEDAFICPQQFEFETTRTCTRDMCPLESSILRPPCTDQQREIFERSPCLVTCGLEAHALKIGHVSKSERLEDEAGRSASQSNIVGECAKFVCMTLCKKPPRIKWADGKSEDVFRSPAIATCLLPVQGQGADEFLPFFVDQEEKEVQFPSHKNRDFNSHHGVMGVPTHYQNDGSLLYLLTPVFSPPSRGFVSKWLLHYGMVLGTLRDSSTVLVEPLSVKDRGFSSSVMSSEGAHADACRLLTESGSDTHVNPILNQPDHEKHQVANMHTKNFCDNLAPAYQDEENYLKLKNSSDSLQDFSQISGPAGKLKPTPVSQMGFQDPASVGGDQQLTMLSVEVHAECRGDLRPDPRFDAINVIALAVQEDNDYVFDVFVLLRGDAGSYPRSVDGISGCKVFLYIEEKQLLEHFVRIIGSFDPDILMGWDIQGGSLGFLAERASHFGIGLVNDISRTPSEIKTAAGSSESSNERFQDNIRPESFFGDSILIEDAIIEDEWGRTHASGIHVGGRAVLNVWRLMRSEIKLNLYTVESVAESVLRRKVPLINNRVLMTWYSSGPGKARYRCIEHVIDRAKLNLEIINRLDLINRTSELARVFGIDFFSVLSRGSQYRVESMLLRLAHTQNYLAISPGNQQVASQPAMECLPLVMEPESGFYADPVVVLDFQSLYPSMVIAYNLCFCTCLGKVLPSRENTLGVTSFSPESNILQELKQQLLVTPNGVMYVPSKVRKGILPRLLEEILSTRIMVKQAMKKLAPSQQILQRIFNARQLALKLIANVTYGYTAAGFSGRMPCAELADSIVQCGRRTLENAISFVNAHEKWKARVVYGDTDSMFVLLKGCTIRESFQIGQEIVSAITAMNPDPVTLKLEKVYQPCFLLTKKRYVGYSYERPDQIEPMFDAKGIETVRRDTCGAVSKTMEHSLRLYFEHQDLLKVKLYLQRQWMRTLSGRVSLQDFVFAKEVRLGTYSARDSSLLPPAAIVATKAMRADPRAEPRYAERIPYVVIHGSPGARLVDMVVDPLDLLAINSPFRLNDLYYIRKQIIPSLQRIFGLVQGDLNQWFSEMPRPARESSAKRHFYAPNSHRTRIDYYYLSKHCILCGELVHAAAHLCDQCSSRGVAAATAVTGRTSKLEREMQHLAAICRHCGGGDWVVESGVKCSSLACSVFFERRKVQKELQALSSVSAEAGFYPRCMIEWF